MTLIIAFVQLVLAWSAAFPQPCSSPAEAVFAQVAGVPLERLCRPSTGPFLPPAERLAGRASITTVGTGG